MKTCLIIGYGRAGKRHAKIAALYGYRVVAVDAYPQQSDVLVYASLDAALANELVHLAVIATPPETHLAYLERLVGLQIPTLCEKPLCGLGQLDQVARIKYYAGLDNTPLGLAYNYRYHSAVQSARSSFSKDNAISHYASQWRELPYWGLLLDHVSHSIDIVDYISGANNTRGVGIKHIDSTVYTPKDQRGNERIIVTGELFTGNWFSLTEEIASESPRAVETTLHSGPSNICYPIDGAPTMFTDMWNDWLAYVDDCDPSLHQRILLNARTQELLQDIYDGARHNSNV